MAQKPRRNSVQDIIKSLLGSEIPEIQSVAKQLADRIKELEEHSWKLQHYATEIENLASEEVEAPSETSLAVLLKDLEKTLDELRQRPGGVVTEPEGGGEAEEKIEEVVGDLEEEEKEKPPATTGIETYTTPEGFVVRKIRH